MRYFKTKSSTKSGRYPPAIYAVVELESYSDWQTFSLNVLNCIAVVSLVGTRISVLSLICDSNAFRTLKYWTFYMNITWYGLVWSRRRLRSPSVVHCDDNFNGTHCCSRGNLRCKKVWIWSAKLVIRNTVAPIGIWMWKYELCRSWHWS